MTQESRRQNGETHCLMASLPRGMPYWPCPRSFEPVLNRDRKHESNLADSWRIPAADEPPLALRAGFAGRAARLGSSAVMSREMALPGIQLAHVASWQWTEWLTWLAAAQPSDGVSSAPAS